MSCVIITVNVRPQSEVTVTRWEVVRDHTLPAISTLLLDIVNRLSYLHFAIALLVEELILKDRWLLGCCLKDLCPPATHGIVLTYVIDRLQSIIIIVPRKSKCWKPLLPERRGGPLLCDHGVCLIWYILAIHCIDANRRLVIITKDPGLSQRAKFNVYRLILGAWGNLRLLLYYGHLN